MQLKKGINIGGFLSQCTHEESHYDTFFDASDMEQISQWGFDHVRLPFDYNVVQDENGAPIESGYTRLAGLVQMAEKYHMNIILDLHKAGGYDFNDAGDLSKNNLFADETMIERFLAIWTEIAERFGKAPHVAFELLNEVVETENADGWNALIERTITAIRALAPLTPIIYGGIKWNSADTLKLLNPPLAGGIIYTFHFYEPLLFTHQRAFWVPEIKDVEPITYPDNMAAYKAKSEILGIKGEAVVNTSIETMGKPFIDDMIRGALAAAEAAGVPLYCGEFGVIDQAPVEDTVRWFADMMDVLISHQIGHAVWTYKQKDFGLIDPHYASVRDEIISILTQSVG